MPAAFRSSPIWSIARPTRTFMEGGTIFTLESFTKAQAEQLEKARAEAYVFGERIGRMIGLIADGGGHNAADDISNAAVDTFRRAAMAAVDRTDEDHAGDTRDDEATRTLSEMTEASR